MMHAILLIEMSCCFSCAMAMAQTATTCCFRTSLGYLTACNTIDAGRKPVNSKQIAQTMHKSVRHTVKYSKLLVSTSPITLRGGRNTNTIHPALDPLPLPFIHRIKETT